MKTLYTSCCFIHFRIHLSSVPTHLVVCHAICLQSQTCASHVELLARWHIVLHDVIHHLMLWIVTSRNSGIWFQPGQEFSLSSLPILHTPCSNITVHKVVKWPNFSSTSYPLYRMFQKKRAMTNMWCYIKMSFIQSPLVYVSNCHIIHLPLEKDTNDFHKIVFKIWLQM